MKMINIVLTGGLGNQLFQFALYKELKHLSIDSKLDFSHLYIMPEHGRTICNDLFLSSEDYIIDDFFYKLIKNKNKRISNIFVSQFLWKLKILIELLTNRKTVIEKKHGFYDRNLINELVKTKGNITLIGYWQSERYFKNIRKFLTSDLNYTHLSDNKNLNLLLNVNNSNSISIHIRRGDYLSKKNNSTHYIFKNLNFYQNAVNYMLTKVIDPVFIVFSDDPSWVKENLKLDTAIYVDWNTGDNSFKDLLLMTKCKHNIIANSSFSWWGAWLNTNEHKIVITPAKWMNNLDTPFIIPEEWVKLPI